MNCVFHFPLQLLLKTVFDQINVLQVMLQVNTEVHLGLRVKCPSLLFALPTVGMCRETLLKLSII